MGQTKPGTAGSRQVLRVFPNRGTSALVDFLLLSVWSEPLNGTFKMAHTVPHWHWFHTKDDPKRSLIMRLGRVGRRRETDHSRVSRKHEVCLAVRALISKVEGDEHTAAASGQTHGVEVVTILFVVTHFGRPAIWRQMCAELGHQRAVMNGKPRQARHLWEGVPKFFFALRISLLVGVGIGEDFGHHSGRMYYQNYYHHDSSGRVVSAFFL